MIEESQIKLNCINIFSHRNYKLLEEINNNFLMIDENGNKIIIFITNSNITIDIIKQYINILINLKINRCIIIYNNKNNIYI